MEKIKIVQIAVTSIGPDNEEVLYGIDGEGNLYYWGKEQVKLETASEDGDWFEYKHGWKLQEDKINE